MNKLSSNDKTYHSKKKYSLVKNTHHQIKIDTNKKIIILGCGSIGKITLVYLFKFFIIKHENVYIIDKKNECVNFPVIQQIVNKGAIFINIEITKHNITHLLFEQIKIKPYDFIIDLTVCTSGYDIVKLCLNNNINYLNTACEYDFFKSANDNIKNDSLYVSHVQFINLNKRTALCPTIILECGMNPGLISLFVKKGLIDLATSVIKQNMTNMTNTTNIDILELVDLIKNKEYSLIAKKLKVRTIHCSEIDTLNTNIYDKSKFLNTWSCMGLLEEILSSIQLSIGYHESPETVFDSNNIIYTSPSTIYVNKKTGFETKCLSYCPTYDNVSNEISFKEINGYVIPHGETLSLNCFLATDNYAPTMHYVYELNPITTKLLENSTIDDLKNISEKSTHVFNMLENKLEGYDSVGATFILESNPLNMYQEDTTPYGYWCGTILDTSYTKNILKDDIFTPTGIQVVCGIIGGIHWMLQHPNKGIIFPEDIDENFVFDIVGNHLGIIYSGPITNCNIKGFSLNDLMQK
jgi:homospermidine synthase